VFGDLERLISEELFPYRYVITPVLLIAMLGAVAFAVSRGVHLFVWRHRVASAIVGLPLLVIAGVTGDYLVSPLFERSFLEEASPIEAAGISSAPADSTQPDALPATAIGAQVLQTGEFKGADDFHFGHGKALVITNPDGDHVLRFEDFSVRNGPDLYVYVSRELDGKRVDEALNLGRLRATDGAFDYVIPASIDVSIIKTVLVWCRNFTVLFASAELKRS
jgi:hypothetical protein